MKLKKGACTPADVRHVCVINSPLVFYGRGKDGEKQFTCERERDKHREKD